MNNTDTTPSIPSIEPGSIIIIGAGIAGLAAGCYAQMNGYRSQIFELHDLPGGLCTAWERKNYVFDGCLHYLFGSGEGQPFNQIWKELGALRQRRMIDHEEFMRVVDASGKAFIVYADPQRLEDHMKQLSPADVRLIEDFAEGVRQFTRFDMSLLQQKPKSMMGTDDWRRFGEKMMPFVLPLAQWGMLSADDLAERFKDPFLKMAIPQMFAWPEIPVMAGLSLLAYMHTCNAGFPEGGSLEFARAIERRYLELGGQIHYKSQVEKILVEDDRAVGVRLYNDEEHFAETIISACDGHGTIYDMLGGRFKNRKIDKIYDGHMPIHAQLQVSLGVNRDLSGEPHWTTYLLEKPMLIAGEEHEVIGVKHYCYDATLAPHGKSAVVIMLRTNYAYWQRIYGRKLYDTEQNQVSQILIDWLESIYPGIKQDIEVVDVATPLSYERYTGNWQGSSCGWLLTKETMGMMIQGINKTLPGLKNFYLAGQWVEPGGSVPLAAMSGRNAIQLICHQDDRQFTTSEN
jgi:phytoene dehydrogenase-like protein